MTSDFEIPSATDIELDPFAIIDILPQRSAVITHSGELTFAEAAQRLGDALRAYDWQQFLTDRRQQQREYQAELFIGKSHLGALTSLMAEIDLHQARQIWNANVPHVVGTLLMLSNDSESQELSYQQHLERIRLLADDAKIGYLLEHSDDMRAWGDQRVQLVARA